MRKSVTTPDGTDIEGKYLNAESPLYEWGKDLFTRISSFKGKYKKEDFLLSLNAIRIREEVNGVAKTEYTERKYDYHLVLRPKELTGVQLGHISVTSLILKPII